MTGEVETEEGVLRIRRIHVHYLLKAAEGDTETAQRAHDVHHPYCPLYRTLRDCVEISTELEIVPSD